MAIKICPICNTHNDAGLASCSNCGAGLQKVAPWQEGVGAYTPEQTELADLAESRLRWRGGTCLTLLLLAFACLLCTGIALQILIWTGVGRGMAPSAATDHAVTSFPAATDTSPPTLYLPTVTSTPLPPPTATATPTRAPCLQQVSSGDSLIALVARCGHRDLDVLALVLERNNLAAAGLIQIGQQIVIPWPTTTPAAAAEPDTTSAQGGAVDAPAATPTPRFSGALPRSTPTLQAGVMWHRVRAGETIVGIAFRYGTDLKVLSELNPEVTFSQCDFGQASGGPSCVVTVYEHQNLRVPAPTATPTLSPTPSGIATATATPVINAPAAFSPPDNRNYSVDELVTLRWVASGSLATGEVWVVYVESLSSGTVYSQATTALSLVVPAAWKETQPGWHGYRWRVQLVRRNGETVDSASRQFLWETGA